MWWALTPPLHETHEDRLGYAVTAAGATLAVLLVASLRGSGGLRRQRVHLEVEYGDLQLG